MQTRERLQLSARGCNFILCSVQSKYSSGSLKKKRGGGIKITVNIPFTVFLKIVMQICRQALKYQSLDLFLFHYSSVS